MNPLIALVRSRNLSTVIQIVFDKIFRPRVSGFNSIKNLFINKKGVEIGGPSRIFSDKGIMPVYSLAENVDGCNFNTCTTWEGKIEEGKNYRFVEGKCGYQFICEGVDVPVIPKNSYDFVLSSNSLEHISNPLKAVNNWLQLLKPDGVIVLILPRKESNFDHKRPVTSFQHLMDDYNNNVGEDDTTHVEEILQLHDLSLDPLAGGYENFKKRSLDNINNRCLHHHVFDLKLLEEICGHFNLSVLVKTRRTIDYTIVAKKVGE